MEQLYTGSILVIGIGNDGTTVYWFHFSDSDW
jgi:hypothetical protein